MQRVLAYVGSDAACIKVTADGIVRTKSVANPLLSPFTLTDNIPLLVAVALPSMRDAQEASARVKSASNLRQIGQGLKKGPVRLHALLGCLPLVERQLLPRDLQPLAHDRIGSRKAVGAG